VRIGPFTIDSPGDWRLELTAATQRLLGDTIALTNEDWRADSLLAGWTRAHIASHLAFQAQALAKMAHQLRETQEPVAWKSMQPDAVLNLGAQRNALALQEDLDQSSADLMNAFDLLDESHWKNQVQTSQGTLPSQSLLLDRLNEIIVHHVDLVLGFEFTDVQPAVTRALLQWNLFRAMPRFTQIRLRINSDEGFSVAVGAGTKVTVRGSEAQLLAWLTGRKDSSGITGADDLDLGGPV